MRFLLAAINSRFNHTNIAVRGIARFVGKENVFFDEWTINQSEGEILRGLAGHKPDVVIFSTYIWNAAIVQKLLVDIKKILPDVILGLGGPEATYNSVTYLNRFADVDFVCYGEGETATEEIVQVLENGGGLQALKTVKGLFVRDENGEALFTGERELICNLDVLPFVYDDLSQADTKIYYYESSRGCPFSCAYCMSSLDKRVRFKSLEKVKAELKLFLDAGVKLVKFVDRTYNLQEDRYLAIWQFILDNHNGKTMFHFEIEAEYLSEKALDFLKKVPHGVMQFEIGVQSSNPEVLKAAGRSPEIKKLGENIRRIPGTIHKHLDLIAGLPLENLDSFANSYDYVMGLKPDALQLGFLKVLAGTKMFEYAKEGGWLWMENPPYETFSTPFLSWEEMLFLKDVEVLTDAYWNCGIFGRTMEYVFEAAGGRMWNFMSSCARLARRDGTLDSAKKPVFWFDWLAENCEKLDAGLEKAALVEKLKYDFMKLGKTGNFPAWFDRHYDKDKHLAAMIAHEEKTGIRINYRNSEWDVIDGKEILFVY